MTQEDRKGLTKIQLWIGIVVAVVGFTAASLGGYYGGKADIDSKFSEMDLVNQRQDIEIENCKQGNKDVVEALEKTNKELRNLIRIYCANTGIVIEERD